MKNQTFYKVKWENGNESKKEIEEPYNMVEVKRNLKNSFSNTLMEYIELYKDNALVMTIN
ncbi:MAG: hypothetical protein ACW98D_20060 [Promethearchaeota archaeon]|jgi:hypothetical protein